MAIFRHQRGEGDQRRQAQGRDDADRGPAVADETDKSVSDVVQPLQHGPPDPLRPSRQHRSTGLSVGEEISLTNFDHDHRREGLVKRS